MAYCYRCDQCGVIWTDDERREQWGIIRRAWSQASDHYERDIDLDFCALACMQAWAAHATERED